MRRPFERSDDSNNPIAAAGIQHATADREDKMLQQDARSLVKFAMSEHARQTLELERAVADARLKFANRAGRVRSWQT